LIAVVESPARKNAGLVAVDRSTGVARTEEANRDSPACTAAENVKNFMVQGWFLI